MTLFSTDGITHERAEAQEVFDVSGAGDTVIATLAVMLGSGTTLVEGMRWANRAAGIVVGKLGAATATREELKGTIGCYESLKRGIVTEEELLILVQETRAAEKKSS